MCGKILKPITSALGLTPSMPSLPPTADPNVAKRESAERAAAADLERRKRVQAGGRESTILAGRAASQDQQKKTLLGQ